MSQAASRCCGYWVSWRLSCRRGAQPQFRRRSPRALCEALMELRPILSAMLRNKTGAILVGLQIALTLAVVANAVFIIMQRVEKIGRPPGIDSDNLFFVQSYGFGPNYDQRDTIERDLQVLRSISGVVSASPINGIP